MRITTGLSTRTEIDDACKEAAAAALEGLEGASPDLCIVFASGSYGTKTAEVPGRLTELVDPDRLIGCAAGGVIGGGFEIEGSPALSVTLIADPSAVFELRHLIEQDLPDDDTGPRAWTELFAVPPADASGFILLPDPFTFPTDRLLAGLDFAYPHTEKVGGLVSGSPHPGGNMMFLDQSVYHEGAVVLLTAGGVGLETVVAQGCRPFGKVGTLTKVRDNRIHTIDGVPAMQFLQEQIESLPEVDRERTRTTTPVFLGVEMNPFASDAPTHGEYLIRNLLGFEQDTGALAVGTIPHLGRRVQFHLRDGECSAQDLESVLTRGVNEGNLKDTANRGALLFSCLGRGEHLYGRPNHDTEMFQRIVGRLPLSGFFCNGEIGPVSGETYVHGYTSAFAVLREKTR